MNIGIYIPGLGEKYREESVIKYATRFMNEYNWNNTHARNTYTLKHEKILLNTESQKNQQNRSGTTKVSIIEKNSDGEEVVIYRFYDLMYEPVLTGKFSESNIFRKSILLLLTIARKSPRILFCMFQANKCFSQKKKFQSFYAVILLIVLSLGGLLLIPSFITLFSGMDALPAGISNALKAFFHNKLWEEISNYIVAGSLTLLTLMPRLNVQITSLTTKLICIHYYLQIGERKQAIQGQLDNLLEYISENEDDNVSYHLHACDFGAIIAYDFLFPTGAAPTERTKQKITCFCTISFPYEFIASYYPRYFTNRHYGMSEHLAHWYNIFSLSDFFSTNLDPGNFSKLINQDHGRVTTCNMEYEIVSRESSLFDFIAFFSIKTYKFYWDDSTDGSSCLRSLVQSMTGDKIL